MFELLLFLCLSTELWCAVNEIMTCSQVKATYHRRLHRRCERFKGQIIFQTKNKILLIFFTPKYYWRLHRRCGHLRPRRLFRNLFSFPSLTWDDIRDREVDQVRWIFQQLPLGIIILWFARGDRWHNWSCSKTGKDETNLHQIWKTDKTLAKCHLPHKRF